MTRHAPSLESYPVSRATPIPAKAITPPQALPSVDGPAVRRLRRLLEAADIRLVGPLDAPARAWDVRMHDDRLPRRILLNGALGLGDAYVDGWWDCDDLPEFFNRVLRHDLAGRFFDRHAWLHLLRRTLLNAQSRSAAFANGQDHYDRGNALFIAMLDHRLTYTCGFWKDAAGQVIDDLNRLDEAQEAKLEMTCRKLGLKPGDRVLDIGCGWGSFAGYAAERYGAHVIGITVAREQVALAQERYANLPCEFCLQDYRDLAREGEQFDHIVSLGMFEHVGPKNYRTYMKAVARLLKPGGLFLLHTISTRRSQPNATDGEIVWMDRHIFPGMNIPSLAQIGRAADGLFVVEDLHNFGVHYEKTLLAWHENFERVWPELRGSYRKRAERFYRMWRYYLLTCAGAFRSRKYGLWQIVLSPEGVVGGWERPET